MPSRWSEPSTASRMCAGRLSRPPRSLDPISKPNLVAMTARSRRPARARPSRVSLMYGPYTSAVSKQRHAQLEGAVDGGNRLLVVRGAVELAHAHAAQPEGGDGQALRAQRARRQHARTIGRVELSHHPSVVPPTSTPGCSMRPRVPRLALGLALTPLGIARQQDNQRLPLAQGRGPRTERRLLSRRRHRGAAPCSGCSWRRTRAGPGPKDSIRCWRRCPAATRLLRRLAVRGLGRFQRPELGRRLLPSLADPVPAVRAEAANAVAQSLRRLRRSEADTGGAALGTREAAAVLAGRWRRSVRLGVADALAQSLGRLPLPDSAAGARRGRRDSRALRDSADTRPRTRALHARASAPGHGHAHAREHGPAPRVGARFEGHCRPAALAAHAGGGGRTRQRHGSARGPRSRR